ncbi:hypothetical protein PIB30_025640 [Stylosanthes scabra]|uniref:Uncharacterized protein n=1 Tax=Stylosanthes scabra TaxID=79078 RepID=A0ABU6U8Z2_9FABA|nr:hypothetical protein [Stylosanthes scabra]
MASSSLRMPSSWELIPLSKGWMCDGDDEKEIGGMESSVKKKESKEEDLGGKKKIRRKRKTPRKRFLLLLLYPWTLMLMRTTYASLRNWSIVLSLHLFVAVRPMYQVHQRRHLANSLTAITLRVMISLEFGRHRRRVQVLRVPRFFSTLEA